MELLHNDIKLKRDNVSNYKGKTINLVVTVKALNEAIDSIKQNLNDKVIEKIYLFRANEKDLEDANTNFDFSFENLSDDVLSKDNLVVYIEENFIFTALYSYLSERRVNYYYYLVGNNSDPLFESLPNAEIIEMHKQELQKVYNFLSDKQSKMVYANKIKSLEEGLSGYVEQSDYYEYFHPLAKPVKGDYVIDAGVSRYIGPTTAFLNTVGEKGKVFAFEPEITEYNLASERLRKNYGEKILQIFNLGLWNKKDVLKMSSSPTGASSLFWGDQTAECKTISIDEFVEENYIPKIDFIKMDIEGAEIEALQGAIKTIKKFRPKLAISLYHKIDHLYQIPMLLNSLNLGYKFYVGQHSPFFVETDLYAVAHINVMQKMALKIEKIIKRIKVFFNCFMP